MKVKMYVAASALMMGMSGAAVANPPASAASCDGCHAPGNPVNPHLCGQPEGYLVTAIEAYKNGNRNHAMMSAMVAGLAGPQVQEVAAYYSKQSCQ